MKFKYLSYTTRIWWLSVWLSPIIWSLTIILEEGNFDYTKIGTVIVGYLAILLVSAIISLPAYGIFILSNELIFQNSNNIIVGKVITSLFGLSITYLVLHFFLGSLGSYVFGDDETFYLITSYAFTIFSGIWYYEPFPKT